MLHMHISCAQMHCERYKLFSAWSIIFLLPILFTYYFFTFIIYVVSSPGDVTAPDFAPSVIAVGQEQVTYPGSSVQLRCIVSPDPSGRQPAVNWSRLNSNLPTNSLVRGEVLQLTDVTYADAGRYICEIMTHYGPASDFIDLRVDSEYLFPFGGFEKSWRIFVILAVFYSRFFGRLEPGSSIF